MTKGQNRPEVMVATEGPGEPGPMDGWSRIPLLEPPRLHKQLRVPSLTGSMGAY